MYLRQCIADEETPRRARQRQRHTDDTQIRGPLRGRLGLQRARRGQSRAVDGEKHRADRGKTHFFYSALDALPFLADIDQQNNTSRWATT